MKNYIIIILCLFIVCSCAYKSKYRSFSFVELEELREQVSLSAPNDIEGYYINSICNAESYVIVKNNLGIPDCDYIGILYSTTQEAILYDFLPGVVFFTLKKIGHQEYRWVRGDGRGNFILYHHKNTLNQKDKPVSYVKITSQSSYGRDRYSTLPSGSYGTGWLSDTGYIITNYHVISGYSDIYIEYKGKRQKGQVVISDKNNDIALITVEDISSLPRPLHFSNEHTSLGNKVFTVGFPEMSILGQSAKYSEGTISSVLGMNDDPRYLQTSIPILPGNSGGPLLDSNGNVCGMITSKINEINFAKHTRNTGSTISYAIKASYIKALVTSGGNPMKLLSNKDFPVKKNLDSIVLQVFAKN